MIDAQVCLDEAVFNQDFKVAAAMRDKRESLRCPEPTSELVHNPRCRAPKERAHQNISTFAFPLNLPDQSPRSRGEIRFWGRLQRSRMLSTPRCHLLPDPGHADPSPRFAPPCHGILVITPIRLTLLLPPELRRSRDSASFTRKGAKRRCLGPGPQQPLAGSHDVGRSDKRGCSSGRWHPPRAAPGGGGGARHPFVVSLWAIRGEP